MDYALIIDGKQVHAGDTIFDFRGEPAVYERVSAAPTESKTGKVIVHAPGHPARARESYPTVFNGTIEPVESADAKPYLKVTVCHHVQSQGTHAFMVQFDGTDTGWTFRRPDCTYIHLNLAGYQRPDDDKLFTLIEVAASTHIIGCTCITPE